jgi:hypothetical protein
MRPFLIAMATVALLGAGAGSSEAASFFNKRYCLVPGGSASGAEPDCSYNTWEQCRQSTYGSKYCSENPNWKPQATPRGRKTGQE